MQALGPTSLQTRRSLRWLRLPTRLRSSSLLRLVASRLRYRRRFRLLVTQTTRTPSTRPPRLVEALVLDLDLDLVRRAVEVALDLQGVQEALKEEMASIPHLSCWSYAANPGTVLAKCCKHSHPLQ